MRFASIALAASLAACGDDPAPEQDTPEPKQYDVLVVTLDTTRPDRLGCYGHQRVHTPVLDALAGESTVFDLAFTPVPSTLPSHCTIFTGLYPEQHGVHDNGCYALPEQQRTLAEVLEDQGWKTAAFVAAFVLDRQFRLDQGFDVYDCEMDTPLVELDPGKVPRALPEGLRRWYAQLSSAYQRPAEIVTARARQWLRTELEERPYFLWLHYFDPHAPYGAPGEYETRYDPDYEGPMDGRAETFMAEAARRQEEMGGAFTRQTMDRDVQHMIARYDGELAYLDAQLGVLIEDLRERGRWENTLVVVVGDHGESFGEHMQIWEHNGEVYDEVVRVPLMIRRPGGAREVERSGELVRTLDVMPTVLDVLGIDGPWMEGVSLRPLLEDPAASGPGSVFLQAMRYEQVHASPQSYVARRDETSKTLVTLGPDEDVRAAQHFDLAKDREEQRGQPPSSRDDPLIGRARALVEELHGLRGRPSKRPVRPLGQLDSEALRNLGYIDDGEDEEDAEGEED